MHKTEYRIRNTEFKNKDSRRRMQNAREKQEWNCKYKKKELFYRGGLRLLINSVLPQRTQRSQRKMEPRIVTVLNLRGRTQAEDLGYIHPSLGRWV